MKRNYVQKIKYVLATLYLLFGYTHIIYYISYTVRITNKAEGWLYMIAVALFRYIVYVIINHVIIKRIVRHKVILLIEVLLFIAMLTLLISDLMYDHYIEIRYLKSIGEI